MVISELNVLRYKWYRTNTGRVVFLITLALRKDILRGLSSEAIWFELGKLELREGG